MGSKDGQRPSTRSSAKPGLQDRSTGREPAGIESLPVATSCFAVTGRTSTLPCASYMQLERERPLVHKG